MNYFLQSLHAGCDWGICLDFCSVTYLGALYGVIVSMQGEKVDAVSQTVKDVLPVIDSLKKQVAVERIVYVKV